MTLPERIRNHYFAMRHGESEANVAGIIFSDPSLAVEGCGLSARGQEQARDSARAFRLDAPTVIVSSDFRRARETAEIAARVFGLNGVTLAEELRERFFGDWDGLSSLHYQDVWRMDAVDAARSENGVESVRAVAARLCKLIERLESEHSNQRILLVAHGDPLQILQTLFEGVPSTAHRSMPHLDVAEIRLLRRTPVAAGSGAS